MAPPVNTSFATATAIATLPYTFTQSDINDAGTNFTVYYKFTAPAGARVIGAWGFSGNIGAGYQPTIKPYLGPAGAPTQVLAIAGSNVPIQFPVTPGSEYFLEFTKNVNTAGPEHLDVSVLAHTESPITNGDIVISDDVDGYPLAIMSVTADNTVDTFITAGPPPAGEAGDISRNGIMCYEDIGTANVDGKVLRRDFTVLATYPGHTVSQRIRCCRTPNKFYVGFDQNPPLVTVVNEAGTVSGTTYSLTAVTNLESLAADNVEAILYYCQRGFGVPVKRWDLTLNSAMSDLAASIATYQSPDILVLQDGTIVVLYFNSTSKDVQVKRYSTAGATLNTYSLGVQSTSTKPRMAYALDDPNSFWVFTHTTISGSTRTRARNVKVSDGSILTTRDWQQYEGGTFDGGQTATPPSRFGNSFSCSMFIMAGSDFSGLYVLVPDKTDDTLYTNSSGSATVDVKIPNPLFQSYLSSDGG